MLPVLGVRSARSYLDLMPTRPPVRGARTFTALANSDRRARSGAVSVRFLPGARSAAVAYAIPRAVGAAVVRNRLRRRARAVMAGLDLAPGAWLVGFSPGANDLSYEHLFELLRSLTGRVGA
jgi:ribonuclease P protein component